MADRIVYVERPRGCGCGGCIGNFIVLFVLLFALLILFNERLRNIDNPPPANTRELQTAPGQERPGPAPNRRH
jgi:hypothetical protein